MTFELVPDSPPRPRFTAKTGAAAQHAGKTFQEMIEFSAGVHKAIVTLEALPPFGAMRIAGGKMIPRPICLDYLGCSTGGIMLAFDAKACGKDKAGFDANHWHKDRPQQSRTLRRFRKAGAVAGLLVRSAERGLYLWCDISDCDTLDTIRFARDGVLYKEWLSLGALNAPVRFDLLAQEYKVTP